MRIAILSDIHGNLPALQAVRADLETRGAEQIVVLGDLCFQGPHPRQCLQVVRELAPIASLMGQTDEWLVRGLPEGMDTGDEVGRRRKDFLDWARDRLNPEDLNDLQRLPFSYETRLGDEFALFLHATPASNAAWVPLSEPDETLEAHFHHQEATVFFTGHVHVQGLRRLRDRRTIVNPGSVGLPWDGDWRASYAILEVEGRRIAVNLIRVPYNIERTVEDAYTAGLPWAEAYERALRHGQPL